MEVDDLKDLKYCKGEYFKNKHMLIKNDNIHISEQFARILIKKPLVLGYNKTEFIVRAKVDFLNQVVLIFIFKSNGIVSEHPWVVCGCCGSYGFNGLEYSRREQLGVKIKRKAIRKIVEVYLCSNLSRKEKLIDILEK